MIKDTNAIIFTKSYCPVCKDTVERFDDADISVKEVQLDKWGETFNFRTHCTLI
jgi:glutaredoxin